MANDDDERSSALFSSFSNDDECSSTLFSSLSTTSAHFSPSRWTTMTNPPRRRSPTVLHSRRNEKEASPLCLMWRLHPPGRAPWHSPPSTKQERGDRRTMTTSGTPFPPSRQTTMTETADDVTPDDLPYVARQPWTTGRRRKREKGASSGPFLPYVKPTTSLQPATYLH